jgi:branched-chain amino acid transport system substrate-binding protein
VRPDPHWFSRRTIASGAIALLTALALAACGGGASPSAGSGTTPQGNSTGPITIGISLPLDGQFQSDGEAYEQGYELWANDVNAAGGLLGRQVKLTILDDHSSQSDVVTDYQTLFGKDHVDLAFGPYSSLLTTPASEVAARFGMAFVEGAGGAPSVFDTPSNEADHNVFDVSLPIAAEMEPFVNYLAAAFPKNRQNVSIAYPMAQDPFADPPVQAAQIELEQLGFSDTVYSTIFPENGSYGSPAQTVANDEPDVVILGSADVPTVQAFMDAFERKGYTPKLFIAAAGPDGGSSFTNTVGIGNADGMMVPDGWYPGVQNKASEKMVSEYVSKYGGNANSVNADVAEAYSVGQVVAQAVKATGGTDNAKIISYLHGGVTLQTVQGGVKFDPLGENGSASAFVFQWQGNSFNQVLPADAQGSRQVFSTKPTWTS